MAQLLSFLAFAAAVAEEMAGGNASDTALFRRGLNRIDIFLSEQLQAQLRAAHLDIDALQLAERRDVLQHHLTQRITDQMVAVRTTPTIRRFVTGAWARVIADDMLRHGEQSEATMSALKTVDDLLWSVKIPTIRRAGNGSSPSCPGCCSGFASAWTPSPCRQRSSRPFSTSS